MPNKTAIVIAHGHYHTPALLQPLISSLHKKNPDIEVYCPQLPGSDPSRFILGPDSTAEDYIQGPASNAEYPSDPEVLATLNTLVEKLVVDEGKYVLLVAHSAGGWAVGEATKPELDVTTRKAKGEVGGLVGLFFMAAFMCLPGDGMIEVFNASTEHGTKLVEHVRIHSPAPVISILNAESLFFHDLPTAIAQKYAKLVGPNVISTGKTSENPTYFRLPTGYLLCPADKTIPISYQQKMIQDVERRSEMEGRQKIAVYTAPEHVGHEPFLSWTEGVADAVLDFWGKVVKV